MFNSLKEKLKSAVSVFSKKIEKEVESPKEITPLEVSTPIEEIIIKKEIEQEINVPIPESIKEKSLVTRFKEKITTKKLSQEQFNEIFWNLEVLLLENNVAVEVIEKIKGDLSKELVDKQLQRSKIECLVLESLKNSIESLFNIEKINLIERVKEKKPFVICFIGVNGVGKTTSIAKLAYYFKINKISCVMAAADTFRAAAIKQLETHGDNLGIRVIKHDYGSDPAAVAFDSVRFCEAKNIDVVLIDTAGRQHSNANLMVELEKISRVVKPDLKIFVGESITGNDVVIQANEFNKKIGIDAIILSKADIDDKGGAMISAAYVTKKPIIFIGQELGDLETFNKEKIIKNLFE